MNWVGNIFALAAERPLLAIVLLFLTLLVVAAVAFVTAIQHIERVKIVLGWLLRSVDAIAPTFQRRQKQFDIEGHVNLGVKRIQQASLGELGLPTVQIDWIRGNDTSHDFRDGTLILRMSRSSDNVDNINRVALAVARDGVIRDAASYVSDSIEAGLELSVTRSVLKSMGHPLALRKFTNSTLQVLLANPSVRESFEKLEAIEAGGLFSRCLLLELAELTDSLYPTRIKAEEIVRETEDFVDFVYQYAIRPLDAKPSGGLDFIGRYISISFVIVAKQETIGAHGILPYVKATLHCFGGGAESVYLSAFHPNAQAARDIANQVLRAGNPDTGLPVFAQTGERSFKALYHGKTQDVLLIRISKIAKFTPRDLQPRMEFGDVAGPAA